MPEHSLLDGENLENSNMKPRSSENFFVVVIAAPSSDEG
jgi:hypothetical protein